MKLMLVICMLCLGTTAYSQDDIRNLLTIRNSLQSAQQQCQSGKVKIAMQSTGALEWTIDGTTEWDVDYLFTDYASTRLSETGKVRVHRIKILILGDQGLYQVFRESEESPDGWELKAVTLYHDSSRLRDKIEVQIPFVPPIRWYWIGSVPYSMRDFETLLTDKPISPRGNPFAREILESGGNIHLKTQFQGGREIGDIVFNPQQGGMVVKDTKEFLATEKEQHRKSTFTREWRKADDGRWYPCSGVFTASIGPDKTTSNQITFTLTDFEALNERKYSGTISLESLGEVPGSVILTVVGKDGKSQPLRRTGQ